MVPLVVCHYLLLWIPEHTVKKRAPTLQRTGWLVLVSCGSCQLSKTRDVIFRISAKKCHSRYPPRSTASSVAWFGVLGTTAIGIPCGRSGWLQASVCPCSPQYSEWCSHVLWVQQNTRAHTGVLIRRWGWWWAGRGWQQWGSGPVPRGLLTWVYAWKIWSSSHLCRKAHYILLS